MADKRVNNRYNRIGGGIFRPISSRIFNSQIVLREIVVEVMGF